MPGHKTWHPDHDPMARPLGCNGKYGPSGAVAHRRQGEEVCFVCRDSVNHYKREAKRGNPGTGRRLKPCGTPAAARRHQYHNEPLDFACKVALSRSKQEKKARARRRKAAAKKSLDTCGRGSIGLSCSSS